jgi:hypothetical protein
LLDNFDDRYLGAKASDPSVDNDGNALVVGALYFNTTDGVMKVYTASGWIAASSASVATLATFEFVATSGQTVFSGNDANGASLSYVAPALIVTLNGVRLRPGDDYTATNGTSITLASAAALNDELVVDAFGSFLVANTVDLSTAQTIGGVKTFSDNAIFNSNIGLGITNPSAVTGFSSPTRPVVQVTNNGYGQLRLGAVSGTMIDHDDSGNTITTIRSLYGATSASAQMKLESGFLTFGTGTSFTERMRIDSSGRVTKPYQPSFNVYPSNSYSFVNQNIMSWDTARVNQGNHFNTSSGVFTAPVNGIYSFHVVISYYINNSSNGSAFYLRRNGVNTYGNEASSLPNATWQTAHVNAVLSLNANDTVDVRMTGSGIQTIDSSLWTYFSGYLLG